jgi:hypothetical protein
MSRYTKDMPTNLTIDEANRVVADYLGSEGFQYRDERSEMVWRKGTGAATIPQFAKVLPVDGAAHVEAWVATIAVVPGVYEGEQGLDGIWGFAIKSKLKKRIAELEKRLSATPGTSSPADPSAAAAAAAAGAAGAAAAGAAPPPAAMPAAWYEDPAGRHQSRYWDGARWTENVANDGVAATDPL